jgi:beta-glucuronidase
MLGENPCVYNHRLRSAMQKSLPESAGVDATAFGQIDVNRRDILSATAAVGAASLVAGRALAQTQPGAAQPQGSSAPGRGGLLRPQQNRFRNVLDISGLWEFKLDPQEEGEAQGWATALPASRMIPVPCSWNDLFDDARDYLGSPGI